MKSSDEVSVPNEELPLKVLLSRYFSPFWLFRDASRGTVLARAAAYRHNRENSVYLPVYLLRWAVLCAFALAAVMGCDGIQQHAELHTQFYTALVACAGMIFICCFCFACVIGSIYLRFRYE